MPVYTVECGTCHKTEDIFRTIAQMDDLPVCCGQPTHRIITGGCGFSIPDIKPYRSMITGEMIESRSRHRQHLKQHGCIEIGNEVNAHLKTAQPKSIDREKRKRDLAQVVNSKL